jgi:hypothetical protein
MRRPKGCPKFCFYGRLEDAALYELLRAVGAPLSGGRAELAARLRAHPLAAPYADEGRAPSMTVGGCTFEIEGDGVHTPDGLNLDDIKAACRAKGLKVTGSRFKLVLSLLQHAARGAAAVAAPQAAATKKAATKKAPKPKLATEAAA